MTSENAKCARGAGLRYVTDWQSGIERIRCGKGFRFVKPGGQSVKDAATLKRIRSLAIPPAWEKVWICPGPSGHVQATGRDAMGRKQYRYHPDWREVRDENKFNRMVDFGRALPGIRRRVQRDLKRPGLDRLKVLAAIVRLLDLCAIRVGNEEYADQNKSYGLSTLQDRHARVNGSTVHLRFRGKGGRQHELSIEHPVLARIVKKCQDLPGQELFQWVDDEGVVHDVTSGDVNDYLFEISGHDFTSKDFRTWAGTVLAATELSCAEAPEGSRGTRASIARAIERVANRLGNTAAVCRKCYVHPAVVEAYQRGTLHSVSSHRSAGGRHGRERAVLRLLSRHAKEQKSGSLERKLRQSLRRATARKASKRASTGK